MEISDAKKSYIAMQIINGKLYYFNESLKLLLLLLLDWGYVNLVIRFQDNFLHYYLFLCIHFFINLSACDLCL